MSVNEKHIKINLLNKSYDFQQAANSLLLTTPLQNMTLARTWRDGRISIIDSDANLLQSFFNENMEVNQPSYQQHNEGIGLWSAKDSYELGEMQSTTLAANFSNIGNILYYDIKNEDYYDRIYFSNGCYKNSIIDFAINNSEYIKQICKQFYDSYDLLISDSMKYQLSLRKRPFISDELKQRELLDCIYKLFNNFLIKNHNISLGKTPVRILAFLCFGKNNKDISKILNLSKRTVENNLQSLRETFKVKSSFKLSYLLLDSPIEKFMYYLLNEYVKIFDEENDLS